MVFVLGIEYKKENDEESLYDSYDDGIPIKFLINKGRLDFSKIMYESTEKMKLTILNNNTMKKIIFLIMISFISLKSMAGDGDKFLIFQEVGNGKIPSMQL